MSPDAQDAKRAQGARHVMFPNPVVAVFARAPVLGRTKTRLALTVGADTALRIHAELLDRTLRLVTSVDGIDAELWLDGSADRLTGYGVSLHAQCDGDLGPAALAVIGEFNRPGRPAILVGSDCPVVDAGYLLAARDALMRGCDVVVGPVEDGGYILIGMSRPIRELMVGMTWSTP